MLETNFTHKKQKLEISWSAWGSSEGLILHKKQLNATRDTRLYFQAACSSKTNP